jgi:PEP-CTERM motif
MKKLIATIAVAGLGVSAFAQGTVQWTAPGSGFIGQTNGSTYSTFVSSVGNPLGLSSGVTAASATTGNLYYYELLSSSSLSSAPTSLSQFSGTLATAWLDTGLTMTNANTSNGRITPVNGGSAATGNGNNLPTGSALNLVIVGWSANLGTSWATALANLNNWATFSQTLSGTAWFGVGGSVGNQTFSTASPGTLVIGSNAGQINDTTSGAGPLTMYSLYTAPVPEPSTMALAGLGGAALLMFRRRK